MKDDKIDGFVAIHSDLLKSELSNIFVLQRLDESADPRIPTLATGEDQEKEIASLLETLSYDLGGVPKIIISKEGEEKPVFDTYVDSLIQELLRMFHKTRRAVLKAHAQYVVVESMRQKKEFFMTPPPEEIVLAIEEYFWDSLEVAYLRIASFWDRVGQLLSFSFFNIRQYDKEGFTAIIESIHLNYEPMLPELKSFEEYGRIWDYSKTENDQGLKWLLQRRNTLIHSVGLSSGRNDELAMKPYDSLFNHLERKQQRKLRKAELSIEMKLLNFHFVKLCSLFRDCLVLSDFGAKKCVKRNRT